MPKVRYIGDPVAVILAENRSVAEDARDLLDMDYTPLEAVTDLEEATRPGAPLLYEELGTNIALTFSRQPGNVEEVFARRAYHAPAPGESAPRPQFAGEPSLFV